MICSICKKSQNRFIKDFPLSEVEQEIRICSECNQNKIDLSNTLNKERAVESSNYFSDILKKDETSEQAKEYINRIIEFSNEEKISPKEKRIKLEKLKKERDRIEKEKLDKFLMTTGFNFDGYSIIEYKKVISAETVLGTGFLSEFSAGISDLLGSESKSFSSKLEEARKIATNNLILKAIELDANAAIAIDFDYVMFTNNIIGVIVNGTAVNVEKEGKV